MEQNQLDQIRKKYPRVAIVHDWLYGGGAERVVYEMHQMFPDAPIYTSFCSREWQHKLDGKVVTGPLQRWPFSKLRKFLPVLRIWWFTHLDLSGYDLVISSSGNGEAKGIRVPSSTTHVLYCHTPTHFYWRHYDQYLARPGFGSLDPLVRLGLRLLVGPLRRWDYQAAQQPDHIIANSTHIQADIKTYYNRTSTVIYPPVDTERFQSAQANRSVRHGFVAVGRQVPQKYTDIIVQSCSQLGLPLCVLGRGPEHDRLVKIAGPSISFKTDASDSDVADAMAAAQGFIFAALDDFGITPIEAMAAGTPVVAYRGGGALDYLRPGINGQFFAKQTAPSLTQTLREFDPASYDHQKISQSVERFSATNFQTSLRNFLAKL